MKQGRRKSGGDVQTVTMMMSVVALDEERPFGELGGAC